MLTDDEESNLVCLLGKTPKSIVGYYCNDYTHKKIEKEIFKYLKNFHNTDFDNYLKTYSHRSWHGKDAIKYLKPMIDYFGGLTSKVVCHHFDRSHINEAAENRFCIYEFYKTFSNHISSFLFRIPFLSRYFFRLSEKFYMFSIEDVEWLYGSPRHFWIKIKNRFLCLSETGIYWVTNSEEYIQLIFILNINSLRKSVNENA